MSVRAAVLCCLLLSLCGGLLWWWGELQMRATEEAYDHGPHPFVGPVQVEAILARITTYGHGPECGGPLDAHNRRLIDLARRGMKPCAVHPKNPWGIRQRDRLIRGTDMLKVVDWTSSRDTGRWAHLPGVVDVYDSLYAYDKSRGESVEERLIVIRTGGE